MNGNGRGGRAAPNGYKILSIFLAAVLVIAAITELVLWQKDYIVFQNPNKTEEQAEEDTDSGMVVTPSGEGTFLSLNVSALSDETATDEKESETGIKTLTVEFNPTIATDKRVTWSIGFANPSSTWASGKDVNDYVTFTPEENNGPSATLECKQAFGEQIIVTVTSMENSAATDTATVDYARRITDFALSIRTGISNWDTFINFGQSELLIDFAPVSFDEAMTGSEYYDGSSVWASQFTYAYLDNATIDSDDENDPLYTAADSSEKNIAQFSDYTIKDNMLFENKVNSDYVGRIQPEVTLNSEVKDIFYNDYLLYCYTGFPDTWEYIFNDEFEFVGSNFLTILNRFGKISNIDYRSLESRYSDFLTQLVTWLQENPDTPVWTIDLTITGKYSTFEKTFTVRYDPSTVQMPVWSVSLDEENVVM